MYPTLDPPTRAQLWNRGDPEVSFEIRKMFNHAFLHLAIPVYVQLSILLAEFFLAIPVYAHPVGGLNFCDSC